MLGISFKLARRFRPFDRHTILSLAVGSLVPLLIGSAVRTHAAEPSSQTKRPNILYIHSHDTGRYIQPYGYAVPTPNLQRLAEGGILFRRAFSAAPTCSPSRAGLLTGQCPHSSGMAG